MTTVSPDTIPLSLYVHTPWCVQKCPYCDFNSHGLKKNKVLPESAYVKQLLSDLAQDCSSAAESAALSKRPISSIFIGGGTPSLFSPETIQTLLSGIKTFLTLENNIEITLEANPGSVESERFQGYREAGINRISLGIQSFHDQHLRLLGRIHNAQEAIAAVDTARQAGFKNVNLDLMFGLPKQSTQEGLNDLKQAIALEPSHISWYQLTLEPNTHFYKRPPVLPQDDLIWALQTQGQALLADNGYEQYEVSAYTRPGKHCQHNRNYWLFGDYLGIGAGAHSKLTHRDGSIMRTAKLKQPTQYLKADTQFVSESRTLKKEELPLEFMMNALRLNESINMDLFKERTGLEEEGVLHRLEDAEQQGLLVYKDRKICLTDRGRLFLNDVLLLF